jgi:amidase
MGKFMQENEIDLVVSSSDCSLVTFTACAGWPSGTVPLGRDEKGIPFGMFVLAREGAEGRILGFMSAWEMSKSRVERVGVPDLEGIAALIGGE